MSLGNWWLKSELTETVVLPPPIHMFCLKDPCDQGQTRADLIVSQCAVLLSHSLEPGSTMGVSQPLMLWPSRLALWLRPAFQLLDRKGPISVLAKS